MNLREFIANVDVDTLLQCMRDYDQFELHGFIGESVLRDQVKQASKELYNGELSFPLLCEAFIKEVYRRLAIASLQQSGESYAYC